MQTKRSVRIAEFIKREISRIIFEEIKDPGIEFVTITNVTITPDLKYAKIYYSVIGDAADKEKVDARLQAATKFIRSELGKVIEFRHVPEIKFYYDVVTDRVDRLDRLFAKIREEQDSPDQ